MDVETKGEFIKNLIKEVENAEFTNIEDIVTFVKWLDDELSYLFAGGFDMESVTAFQEMKEKVRFCKGQEQKVVGCSTAD